EDNTPTLRLQPNPENSARKGRGQRYEVHSEWLNQVTGAENRSGRRARPPILSSVKRKQQGYVVWTASREWSPSRRSRRLLALPWRVVDAIRMNRRVVPGIHIYVLAAVGGLGLGLASAFALDRSEERRVGNARTPGGLAAWPR